MVSPVWWSCLPSPPLGSGAFPLSSVGWCCLVSSFLLGGVVVFPFPVWWCCLPSPPLGVLPSSVGLLGFLLPFGWCCCFSLSSWCCLVSSFLGVVFLSFYVVLLGFFPLLVVSPVWWCCLPSPPLDSGAFPLSSVGWCCLVSSFLLGGVAVFPSPVGWCCLPSPPLAPTSVGWCCLVSSFLLGGVVVLPSPFGGVLLHYFFLCSFFEWCCVPSPFAWCCLVSSLFGWSLLFGGAAFHPLLCVVVRFPLSSVGWCC